MEFTNNKLYLKVKDHSVSGETFELQYDENLDMLFTFPKPDAQQLPKYYESEDYISHTDGKRTLFEKTYQFIKNIALANKLKLINNCAPKKGSLLDIGAGTGDFLLTAKNNGWNTIGFEPNSKAKEMAQKKGINFTENTTDLQDHSFDIITMWHVLEHVLDLENQIKELKRLVKKDGTIIIAVPNFNSFDAKYYNEFWAAFDTPRHLWHFSKTAIEKLFEKENVKLVSIKPMKFDSYYVSLLSEKYKTGKMNFIKAFLVGFYSNWYAKQNNEYSSLFYILKNH
jgi:2-polyprenyl-3-methyl-5-hydroxy-6-metoxy-1,4-benzoquinol methylase